MRVPYQIGITGGIGSGKSTVARIFASLGVPTYDADSRAKSVMTTNAALVKKIKEEFGESAYDSSGKLDRKYLSAQVFGFPERLEKLNSFVHPCVAENYQEWLQAQRGHPYILKEAALLFETGSSDKLDKIIVVTAPAELRLKRVKSRDNRSEKEIQDIMKRQWPEEQSLARADYVIANDEANPLLPQVLKLHEVFKTRMES
jgi:dephospho-CoA kinase